jgi:hypothetical protein
MRYTIWLLLLAAILMFTPSQCIPPKTKQTTRTRPIYQATIPQQPHQNESHGETFLEKRRPGIFSLHQTTIPMPPQQNEPYGDIFLEKKLPGMFRLGYQNVNGIRREGMYSDLYNMCQFMKDHEIDCLGMTETNLDWRFKKSTVQNACSNICRKFFPAYKFVTSCSTKRYKTAWQPGGTATIIQGEWQSRVTSTGADPTTDGRWSEVTTSSEHAKVTFITGYRVSQEKDPHGAKTAWKQQFNLQ